MVHCVRVAAGDASLRTDDYVDEVSIAAAVTITRWFGQETKRIYGMLSESDEERQQRRLLDLIRSKDGRITVRQLMQAARQYRDSAEMAKSALTELVDIGWGRWEQVQAGLDGGRPSSIFVLIEDNGGNKTLDDRPE